MAADPDKVRFFRIEIDGKTVMVKVRKSWTAEYHGSVGREKEFYDRSESGWPDDDEVEAAYRAR
jgi:hypothetical protein